MNARSHIMIDAQLSPYQRGEIPLAKHFIENIPEKDLSIKKWSDITSMTVYYKCVFHLRLERRTQTYQKHRM